MMKPESKRPIQIEDLLRLKRAERPPGDFWSEFDRQLRAKQLAALVEKRPWWQRIPRFSGLVRYSVPLGAATALAITFVSLREDDAAGVKPAVKSAAPAAPVAVRSERPVDSTSTARHVSSDTGAAGVIAGAGMKVPATTDAVPTLASEATSPGELTAIIPLLGASGADNAPVSKAGARYATNAFVSEPAVESVLGQSLLAGGNTFMARSAAVEPLQQIAPPRERRHAKLLTAMATMQSAAPQTRASGGARAADQISEENLYDTVRRFGAHGAGLRIKL